MIDGVIDPGIVERMLTLLLGIALGYFIAVMQFLAESRSLLRTVKELRQQSAQREQEVQQFIADATLDIAEHKQKNQAEVEQIIQKYEAFIAKHEAKASS